MTTNKRSVDSQSYQRPPRVRWAGRRGADLDKDGLFYVPGIGTIAMLGDRGILIWHIDEIFAPAESARECTRRALKLYQGVRRLSTSGGKRY